MSKENNVDGSVGFLFNTDTFIKSIKESTDLTKDALESNKEAFNSIRTDIEAINSSIRKTVNEMALALDVSFKEFSNLLKENQSKLKNKEKKDEDINKGKIKNKDTNKQPKISEDHVDDLNDNELNDKKEPPKIRNEVFNMLKEGINNIKKDIWGEDGEDAKKWRDGVLGKLKSRVKGDVKEEDTVLSKIVGTVFKGFILKKALDALGSMIRSMRDFISESLSVASDIEETQNVVNTSFKGSEEAIESFANTSIQQLGISSLKAKQYASTYKSMMNSLTDVNEELKVSLSTTLTGMAADIGSFYSATLSTDEAFEMLKAPLDKQSLKVARIGINMTQEALDDWSKRSGIIYSDLSLQEQTLMRIAYIMEMTKSSSGDFIKNSTSWHNQLELIKNKMEQIKGDFGELFINIFKPGLQFVNDILSIIITKTDTIIGKLYNLLGIERPEKIDINRDTNSGMSPVIQNTPLENHYNIEDKKEDNDKKNKTSNKELDLLGIDNIQTLKTDYTDPEKEKDRKQRSSHMNQVVDILNKNMRERESLIQQALNENSTFISEGTLNLIEKIKSFFEPYQNNFNDIGEGIKALLKGVIELIKDTFKSFSLYSEEIGNKDLLDSITEELKRSGTLIGEILSTSSTGKNENQTIGDIIGKIIAYYVKFNLLQIYGILRIFNAILSIINDTDITQVILRGIELYLMIMVKGLEIIIGILDAILQPIINPSGAAEDVLSEREEMIEQARRDREDGTFNPVGFALQSAKVSSKHMINSLAAGIPDMAKFLFGNADATYARNYRKAKNNDKYFGKANVGTSNSSQSSNSGSNQFHNINNDIRVILDGDEVSRKVEERGKRNNRMLGQPVY